MQIAQTILIYNKMTNQHITLVSTKTLLQKQELVPMMKKSYYCNHLVDQTLLEIGIWR